MARQTIINKQHQAAAGVAIARFQVDELHHAHAAMLTEISKLHSQLIVLLGVADTLLDFNDPLPFQARQQMVLKQFPNALVLPIRDVHNDEAWTKNLDSTLIMLLGIQKAVLYGSRDSFIASYSGVFPVVELPVLVCPSGTEIRQKIGEVVVDSADWRKGVIWSTQNRYPVCFPTADVAVLNDTGKQILLGRKKYSSKWCFFGGFADAVSPTYEADARREVSEESNGIEISEPEYIGSALSTGGRYAKSKDKIKTLFFKATFIFGQPKGTDDIEEVRWFDLKDVQKVLSANHMHLFEMLKTNLKK